MGAQRKVRVLVADDDPALCRLAKRLLSKTTFVVVGEARDGLQAIEATCKLCPDVVLMDFRLPCLNGLEAARRIQEMCPTPIVMLTAYDIEDLETYIECAGVGAYLSKPPKARDLEQAITIAMAHFHEMQTLRNRNRALADFAHMVAHDLKAPLTPIMSAAEIIFAEYEGLSQDEVRTTMQALYHSTRKMHAIIQNLLMLAEADAKEITLEVLDMAEVVAGAIERVDWMIRAYDVVLEMPESWPPAWGLSGWVEGVWANYISNAIRHGGATPHVVLGAALEKPRHADDRQMVRFWVQDSGKGIPKEKQSLLFNFFERLGKSDRGGHGLGLAIVRRVVERLGGQVGVESVVGEGSTFYFTLPAA